MLNKNTIIWDKNYFIHSTTLPLWDPTPHQNAYTPPVAPPFGYYAGPRGGGSSNLVLVGSSPKVAYWYVTSLDLVGPSHSNLIPTEAQNTVILGLDNSPGFTTINKMPLIISPSSVTSLAAVMFHPSHPSLSTPDAVWKTEVLNVGTLIFRRFGHMKQIEKYLPFFNSHRGLQIALLKEQLIFFKLNNMLESLILPSQKVFRPGGVEGSRPTHPLERLRGTHPWGSISGSKKIPGTLLWK